MKILVTGGAGFIGKYLVKSLLKMGHSVTIFDNFSNSKKEGIDTFLSNSVNVIEGDIMKYQEIVKATKDIDIIIHLAAKISVSESIKNPLETFQVNVEGTKNILKACEMNHIKKLIVSSSAAVYGEGMQNSRLNEQSNKNPISPYGESKKRMEDEIMKFALKKTTNCIILRFFNIYGIGQTLEYAGVITKFIKKIKEGKNLEIFGDGLQKRDFVAIEDVIDSINKAISSNNNGIYNIASGKITTIKELAEYMISISKTKPNIKYVKPLKGDIRNSQADISLAKKELEYLPKYKLEQIKKMME